MNRLLWAACAGLALGSAAQAHWLVSEAEATASRAAPTPPATRAVPAVDAPRINLLAPNLASAVPSPTRIQLRFEPVAPAAIRPESLRVRYGSFRLDITGRITATSRVTADGIDVAEAQLPKGAHRLFVEIQDTLGRTAERQLQFVVE